MAILRCVVVFRPWVTRKTMLASPLNCSFFLRFGNNCSPAPLDLRRRQSVSVSCYPLPDTADIRCTVVLCSPPPTLVSIIDKQRPNRWYFPLYVYFVLPEKLSFRIGRLQENPLPMYFIYFCFNCDKWRVTLRPAFLGCSHVCVSGFDSRWAYVLFPTRFAWSRPRALSFLDSFLLRSIFYIVCLVPFLSFIMTWFTTG